MFFLYGAGEVAQPVFLTFDKLVEFFYENWSGICPMVSKSGLGIFQNEISLIHAP
jgi:hypothetical protein